MWNGLRSFYRKNLDNPFINISIPGALSIAVFIARYSPEWYSISTGIVASSLIPLHAYLVADATRSKIQETKLLEKELDLWKNELQGHKWLLNSIKEMIIRKLLKFKKHGYLFDEQEYKDAIMKNLAMLRQFYSHYSSDPGNEFRIVFFKVGNDRKYLESQFYATPDGDRPASHGNTERQKEIFNRSKSTSLAVEVWKDLKPKIAENEAEIAYSYIQQNEKIKSLIGLPVCSGDISEDNLIGILTISSNKEFFKKADLKLHKEYIEQFILRIVFEFNKWENSKQSKK